MSDDGGDVLYCICKKPYNEAVFMIECDVCKDWFHGDCVSIEEHQAGDIDTYHCPTCQRTHGPLKLKRKRSRKKFVAEYSDDLDDLHDVKCGSVSFANTLRRKSVASADKIIKKMKGHMLDKEYIEKNGFNTPILIKDKAGLDLKVPDPSFTIEDVEIAVGSMKEIDVIDVAKQSDMKMLMREFVEYYNNKEREKILNVISLEFSNTKMSEMVTPPRIISELSWVTNYWPESTGDVRTFIRPEVQKYCLMSVKDSYTDFHIDFGGTSVWYHVLRGAKIFYLIEPTDTNLALYETWSNSSAQNTIFFGDQVKACYKLHLKPGHTLFIPTGWIHSVLTPEDSLVFGGNFIHNYNIKLQLEVYEMEKRLGTPERFSFPNLETLYWYAAKNLVDMLKGALDGGKAPCKTILDGCLTLKDCLKRWMGDREPGLKRHKECIPEGISHVKVVKEFSQLISQLTMQSSPSKSRRIVSSPSPSPTKFTQVKKRQAPLKVKAKKRSRRTSTDKSHQVKKEISSESTSITQDIPEQKELRGDNSDTETQSPSKEEQTKDTEYSAESDRATLLGLKFKLNRTQGSIKSEPQQTAGGNQSDDSDSSSDDNVVVDDQPVQPTETIKRYRFSLGGKNINDLSSASDEVLSSDTNRSPTKVSPNSSFNQRRQIAWSKGIENLVKATSTQHSTNNSRDVKVPTGLITTPGVPRKERQGTKLSRPVMTSFLPTPSVVEREKTEQPVVSQSSGQVSTSSSYEDAMEKRLKSCYTDDTYVYPALEDSDYDDDHSTQPPKKKKAKTKDDSWVPHSTTAKKNQPIREKRPTREHAVKPSVKALEMTREYLEDRPEPITKQKRAYTKRVKHKPIRSEQEDDSSDEESLVVNTPSMSMDHGYHLPLPSHSLVDSSTSKSKIRKSGTTTKQRLGKLLKLF